MSCKQRYLSKYINIWLLLGYLGILSVLSFEDRHLWLITHKKGIKIFFMLKSQVFLFSMYWDLGAGKTKYQGWFLDIIKPCFLMFVRDFYRTKMIQKLEIIRCLKSTR
ncbi:hypothetical protein NSTC745_03631 [Nostoc sp. DSM 114161]